MKSGCLISLIVLLVVAGCVDAPLTVSTPTPVVRGSSAASAVTKVDPMKRKADLEKRLHAAIELDAHPQGWDMVEAIARCTPPTTQKCRDTVDKVTRISIACYDGGRALRSLEDGDLDAAETKIEEAEESAERVGPKRKKALVQQQAVVDAGTECETNIAPCRAPCDEKNDLPACIAVGVYLKLEKKYDDARAYLKKGCDGDYEVSCNLLKNAEKQEADDKKSEAAKVETSWSNVKSVADDLATKKFLYRVATGLKGKQNVLATQRMNEHIGEIAKDYCAAMKEFVSLTSTKELGSRAKAHCTEEPPTATGLNGEETLTAECTQVFATSCP